MKGMLLELGFYLGILICIIAISFILTPELELPKPKTYPTEKVKLCPAVYVKQKMQDGSWQYNATFPACEDK